MEEEEGYYEPFLKYEPIPVCRCLQDDESTEKIEMSQRKKNILTTVIRTESYLRERRIPELVRFLMTKLLADCSDKPVAFLKKLLDECMLFRAGLGLPPVLYEKRHLEAVIKSFDPGNRGWLSAGQVQRAFTTLGLPPAEFVGEKISTDKVLQELERIQEEELFQLVSAGTLSKEESIDPSSSRCTSH